MIYRRVKTILFDKNSPVMPIFRVKNMSFFCSFRSRCIFLWDPQIDFDICHTVFFALQNGKKKVGKSFPLEEKIDQQDWPIRQIFLEKQININSFAENTTFW
jgi:hypothetical protein